MSDIEANAAQARRELRLTEAAFDTLRDDYLKQAVAAQDQNGVMAAIAAVRILEDVRRKLLSHVQTLEIEQAVQADQT